MRLPLPRYRLRTMFYVVAACGVVFLSWRLLAPFGYFPVVITLPLAGFLWILISDWLHGDDGEDRIS